MVGITRRKVIKEIYFLKGLAGGTVTVHASMVARAQVTENWRGKSDKGSCPSQAVHTPPLLSSALHLNSPS